MNKNILFRTNFVVCMVIIVGFIITSFLSYCSNYGIIKKDVENVSRLTSEGIYHQIDSVFTKPINISLTMANDSLLKDFLEGEGEHPQEETFINTMRSYLNAYREKYRYDSVFLASAQTQRYYYFDGLDRILAKGDPENQWFYNFLEEDADYGIQIDNDQVGGAGNEVTVFINARIEDGDGSVMGVVGVGFRVDSLQSLLKRYEQDFDITASLIDEEGNVEISSSRTGYEGNSNLFSVCAFPELKESILNSGEESQNLWYSSGKGRGYVVSRFIENLGWYLIVENDTSVLNRKLVVQLFREIVIAAITMLVVLVMITGVIRRYNKEIIELTLNKEKKHQSAFKQATEQMYEKIYEIDITHNQAASEAAAEYFVSLGAPPDIPYDEALKVIADKQIKEEYRQGYLDTFGVKNVLKSYDEGIENLQYDFLMTSDGNRYYWMRISAHIFCWGEDNSVRMMVYRQNIDEGKRQELYMMEQMQKDSLTGLYNKVAAQEHVRQMLEMEPEKMFAFFILDIDHFKEVNDCVGHSGGDEAIVRFAQTLQEQFRKEDVVGRIGGDEFLAFMPVSGPEIAKERAEKLVAVLQRRIETELAFVEVTASIGVALTGKEKTDFETMYKRADYALYQAKKQGRNRFVMAKNELPEA